MPTTASSKRSMRSLKKGHLKMLKYKTTLWEHVLMEISLSRKWAGHTVIERLNVMKIKTNLCWGYEWPIFSEAVQLSIYCANSGVTRKPPSWKPNSTSSEIQDWPRVQTCNLTGLSSHIANGCSGDTGRNKGSLTVTLLDYMDVTVEEVELAVYVTCALETFLRSYLMEWLYVMLVTRLLSIV